jgi:hypothetical protein
MTSRDAILQEIARQEQRLAELERTRDDAAASLESLRAELATASGPPLRLPPAAVATVPLSSADKVKLFRVLFRGRLDVFPTRFVSKKTGKPGYAPACSNSGNRGSVR